MLHTFDRKDDMNKVPQELARWTQKPRENLGLPSLKLSMPEALFVYRKSAG